jgi:hypothetical protein
VDQGGVGDAQQVARAQVVRNVDRGRHAALTCG